MVDRGSESLNAALALVAPGRPLRAGLDRILQAKRGALVVVGDDAAVLSICTGGFLLDAEFSPQRLSELAKMDGAIILTPDASRIARANVHLVPKASIPTTETGTRHRTAERVARSIEVPVITVSESMASVAVYRGPRKHTLQRTGRLVDRASQAVSAAHRFKGRFDVALAMLSTLEVEDTVAVRDVVAVLRPGEMVLRFAEEIEGYLVELGEDGRLIRLQIEELEAGVGDDLRLVVLDYVALPPGTLPPGTRPPGGGPLKAPSEGAPAVNGPHLDGRGAPGADGSRDERQRRADEAVAALRALHADELADPGSIASTLGLGASPSVLDLGVEARGYRLLHRLPRLSNAIVDRIVDRFGTLPLIMQASLAELEQVGGVGIAKARSVQDGLARIIEASILERYE
ncbi:MAG TPA: DNA integrity scanning diadenylate cyclase DisA [Acidimicrobiales bacterium]